MDIRFLCLDADEPNSFPFKNERHVHFLFHTKILYNIEEKIMENSLKIHMDDEESLFCERRKKCINKNL